MKFWRQAWILNDIAKHTRTLTLLSLSFNVFCLFVWNSFTTSHLHTFVRPNQVKVLNSSFCYVSAGGEKICSHRKFEHWLQSAWHLHLAVTETSGVSNNSIPISIQFMAERLLNGATSRTVVNSYFLNNANSSHKCAVNFMDWNISFLQIGLSMSCVLSICSIR